MVRGPGTEEVGDFEARGPAAARAREVMIFSGEACLEAGSSGKPLVRKGQYVTGEGFAGWDRAYSCDW